MGKAIIIKGADFSQVAVANNTIPVTGLAIIGASETQTLRQVQLSVSYTPANTTQVGVVWSVVSGDATITASGLLTYNGGAVNANVVVKATSVKNANVYAQATVSFAMPAIEAPTFAPAQGTYNAAQTVALSCATAGVEIYYTTDGTTPFATSTRYTSPITVNESMTIKAIAVKDGLSSAVATSNYTIEILRTVTVNVTDGNDGVTGATVRLVKDGTQHTPSSVTGASYEFAVPDGSYTLTVNKDGYFEHSETVVVSASMTKTVVIDAGVDLLDYAELDNKHNIYVNDGRLCYESSSVARAVPLVKTSDQATNIAWKTGYAKSGYSVPTFPAGTVSMDVSFTNSVYKLSTIRLFGNSGNSYSNEIHSGFLYRYKVNLFSGLIGIALFVLKKDSQDSTWPDTLSFSDLGMMVHFNTTDNEKVVDITDKLHLQNGVLCSNNSIDANEARGSFVGAKTDNPGQSYASGDAKDTIGANYCKPYLPFGVKGVRITMTNSDYYISFKRLIFSANGQSTEDADSAIDWTQGSGNVITKTFDMIATPSYIQCVIKAGSAGTDAVNATKESLGFKFELIYG